MNTQQINLARKWFPHLPTTKAQFYLRLSLGVYVLVISSLLVRLHPFNKAVNIVSLFLQLGSGALLFWESVAQRRSFDLLDRESQLQSSADFSPSRPERIVGRIGSFFSIVLYFGAILVLAAQVYLLSKPGEIKALVLSELLVFGVGSLLFALMQAMNNLVQRSILNYASQTKKTRVYADRIDLIRLKMRQIAFVLFTTGVAIQIGLAFVS